MTIFDPYDHVARNGPCDEAQQTHWVYDEFNKIREQFLNSGNKFYTGENWLKKITLYYEQQLCRKQGKPERDVLKR